MMSLLSLYLSLMYRCRGGYKFENTNRHCPGYVRQIAFSPAKRYRNQYALDRSPASILLEQESDIIKHDNSNGEFQPALEFSN